MLSLVKIKNVALIDELSIEFGNGLNVLTGETGSGKSIVVDSLGALTGSRVSGDLIKAGRESARIEGIFTVPDDVELRKVCEEAGIELEPGDIELIIRRDISAVGKNRIFVNDQIVTAAFLKKAGESLVAIHGQGEHATLFESASHLQMLDDFAPAPVLIERTAVAFQKWHTAKTELGMLQQNEAEKLQMLDILRFQVNEIKSAALTAGEERELEEERRRLNNIEKLSSLSGDAYALLYENESSTLETLEKARLLVHELADLEPRFTEYGEGLDTAHAVLEDLAFSVRDYRGHLEFSPQRLNEIGDRLAEISRITRKYGGTVESALDHLEDASERLENIETAEEREEQLRKKILELRHEYVLAAVELHSIREKAAAKFSRAVEEELGSVALEKAQFVVKIDAPDAERRAAEESEKQFTPLGFDRVEFYFSANAGEQPKPLAKVASGGEASRLMLVLKTAANEKSAVKTAIFDEVDTGIGGRVAEAVGTKLHALARHQQVLCVTHQPQVAAKADVHFQIEKKMTKDATSIFVRRLVPDERVEEVARMLAGEKITEAARSNAREMIAGA